MDDLFEDLRDGHNLVSLLEVLSGDSLVRYHFYSRPVFETNVRRKNDIPRGLIGPHLRLMTLDSEFR